MTRDQRAALATLLRAGYSQRSIAKDLGINQSSISRELRRNPSDDGSYHASHAEAVSCRRRKRSKLHERKIENDPLLAEAIELRLHPLVSPEVVAHDLPISPETVYAWIYRSRPDLKKTLPQRGRKRRRYGSKRGEKQGWTKNVRSIHDRSKEANERSRTGHFEGDTVRGSNGALLTLTDRKSRYEVAIKLPNEQCDPIHAAIVKAQRKLFAKSFTFDRGSGFAIWRMIEKDTEAKVYFADPHAPWQRGTNENSNQRLRRVYPKGTNFDTLSQRGVNVNVRIMNHTKRKCLNWRTPCEVFRKCCTSS